MICDRLKREADTLYKKYVQVWEDVCNIESPTPHKEGVDAVGNYFAARAEEMGFLVEKVPFEKAGDLVIITMNASVHAAPICFSGHIDTVHPVGLFGTPPCRIEGDKIYGPGVSDCKGGVVAGLLAMEALSRVGYDARPVMLLLQCDEEMGSRPSEKKSIETICERAKYARAFFNLESGDGASAVISRKGINTFSFTVKGKNAHSSMCATAGASAVLEAAYKIIECETAFKDPQGITCNCGVVSGGTATNTVPALCTFKADVRYLNSEQRATAIARMEEIAAAVHVPGTETTVTYGKGRLPMIYTEKNARLLADINRIYEENGMTALTGRAAMGGSDAADVTAAGIPCLDNFGTQGGKIHSPEEYGELSSLTEAALRLAIAAYYL